MVGGDRGGTAGERAGAQRRRCGEERDNARLTIVTVLDDRKIRNHKSLDALRNLIALAMVNEQGIYTKQNELLAALRETSAALWRAS